MADFTFANTNVPTTAEWNGNVRDQLCIITSSTSRPSAPATGQTIFETDTLATTLYDGTAWRQLDRLGEWQTYTPSWTATTTNPVIGNGTLTGRYVRMFGRTYVVHIRMVAGSTTTFGSGIWIFSAPSGLSGAASTHWTGWAEKAGSSTNTVVVYSDPTNFVLFAASALADTRQGWITPTCPFTWATNNELDFMCLYETTS